jgi:hypothetical protein
MQGVLGALIGVPATMLIAGGLGVAGVTLWSRWGGFLTQRRGEPIRWGHLVLGVVMFLAGAGLIWGEILLFGPK